MKGSRRVLAIISTDADLDGIRSMEGISSLIVRRRSYAVEIDFHTDSPARSRELLERFSNIEDYRDITEEGTKYGPDFFRSILEHESGIIEEARKMFSQERYWEAHTVLEDLWKALEGSRKRLVQGIIILAASMTHYQMGEMETAEKMYGKSISMMTEGMEGVNAADIVGHRFHYPVGFPETGL